MIMRSLLLLLSLSTGLLAQNPIGALSGKEIVISPGHGYYWHTTLGWTTQRGVIDGLIEDIHTHEIVHDHLIPWLEGSGARVILCRARSRTTEEHVIDNDQGAPNYTESGTWFTSLSNGFGGGTYRYTNTTPLGGSTASFQATITKSDHYPVYVAFRAGVNRTSQARVEIDHAAGTSFRTVDQKRFDLRWLYVGTFPFRNGEVATVRISSQSTDAGVIIADAVKIGDGMGSIVRGPGTSGQLRWRESSRYHAEYFGAPPSVYNPLATGQDSGDDVTCRPLYGEWYAGGLADLYLSLHTNAGGGSGTSTFIHNTAPTTGSAAWQNVLHTRLITDIRANWDPTWTDRGQLSANFGEVRELSTMPGCLVELAFHDDLGGDIEDLHHPNFRAISGRAMARAIMTYLAPGSPFLLDPPKSLSMRNTGIGGALTLQWESIPGATAYRIRLSSDGFAFNDGQVVTGTTSILTGLAPDQVLYAKVAAINASGTGIDSEPVGARVAPGSKSPLLIVNGFDRRDRQVKEHENPKDWIRFQGAATEAIARAGYPFDGATNEAVSGALVQLGTYTCVGWFLGEESTQDETFSALEQFRINAYLGAGGRFFFSGAEVGWDLDFQGSPNDRLFYEQALGQDFVSDDAGTYATQALLAGPLAPLPAMPFDNGSAGIYNVDYPDVVQPSIPGGGQVVLRYSTGSGAGVLHGNGRVLGLGFPIESIVSPSDRALLLERILRILCPLPVEPVGTPVLGTTLGFALRFPGQGARPYVAAASLGHTPGISLADGRNIPLVMDDLFWFSVSPQPLFTGMLGTLDGSGEGAFSVHLPLDPALSGLPIHFSGITLTPLGTIGEIAPWVRIVL
jgi:hypothetical protein